MESLKIPPASLATRASLARAITLVENERLGADALWREARRHCGRAQVVGITGTPGAGKSTLIAALLTEYAARGQRVAVLAVDPSSPISGGALLGDRVRMGEFDSDAVFVRSVSARGHLGGLSRTAGRIIDVFDAAGFDLVIVETVGTGQSEVEIGQYADVRIVLCPPGLGDEVQAIKAGVLEIADLLVVSKADSPLAERTVLELGAHFSRKYQGEWPVQVLPVSAPRGEGIATLIAALEAHGRVVGCGRRLSVSLPQPDRGSPGMMLVLVGATRFARTLAAVAAAAGCEVSLFDSRLRHGRLPQLPGVTVASESLSVALARRGSPGDTTLVVCTRCRELAEEAIRATQQCLGCRVLLPAGGGRERLLANIPEGAITRPPEAFSLDAGGGTLGRRAVRVLADLLG